jgi:hypothetical protein
VGGGLIFARPSYAHLDRLTDGIGLFEHASFREPRLEHGYCTDDVARGLAVLAREPARSSALERMTEVYIAFLERAQLPDGRFHNRAAYPDGRWLDAVGSGDSNGRALFGLGCSAASCSTALALRALVCFNSAASAFDSDDLRPNAWAAIGAAEVLRAHPAHREAIMLLERVSVRLGAIGRHCDWPWPEARLTYDNARLAEARLAAGAVFDDETLIAEGLELLDWLLSVELGHDCFSFVPASGFAIGEPRPGFDQQPIEAGSMADACARAFDITGDERWSRATELAARWFLGVNDSRIPLYDHESGGCCDGLTSAGRNENQGAESTLAMLAAFGQARRVQAASRSLARSGSVAT